MAAGLIPKLTFPVFSFNNRVQQILPNYQFYNKSPHQGCVLANIGGNKSDPLQVSGLFTTTYASQNFNCYHLDNNQKIAVYLSAAKIVKQSIVPQSTVKCDLDVPETMSKFMTLLRSRDKVIAGVMLDIPKNQSRIEQIIYLKKTEQFYNSLYPQIKFSVFDNSSNPLMLIAEIPSNMCFDKNVFFGSTFVLGSNYMDRLIKYDDDELFNNSITSLPPSAFD